VTGAGRGFSRGLALLMAGALSAGCQRQPTGEELAADAARDIAQVEAIQNRKPPPVPVMLQPILFDDIQANRLFEAGCAFAPGGSMGAVLLAQEAAGYVKLGGRIVRLASDPGSTGLPLGAWSHYTGKEFAVRLTKSDGEGQADGAESLRWPARLTVTDPFEQVVYSADGSVQCGA
jgi:hypothetical protein